MLDQSLRLPETHWVWAPRGCKVASLHSLNARMRRHANAKRPKVGLQFATIRSTITPITTIHSTIIRNTAIRSTTMDTGGGASNLKARAAAIPADEVLPRLLKERRIGWCEV